MNRRQLLICIAAVAVPAVPTHAQQNRHPPRVGYLSFGTSSQELHEAFREGMRAAGYVDGRNVVIEYRFAERSRERLRALAQELVRLQPDVIVAPDPPSFGAVIGATKTIPIVMRASYDPVASGIVASLARPGGNVTGVFSLYSELIGKRLDLLKEAAPSDSRVLVLLNAPLRRVIAISW